MTIFKILLTTLWIESILLSFCISYSLIDTSLIGNVTKVPIWISFAILLSLLFFGLLFYLYKELEKLFNM